MPKLTPDDQQFAQKVWDAGVATKLSFDDLKRADSLGLITWPYPNNFCNDVRHGHYVETSK